MRTVFEVLHAVHPLAPALFLLVMANGLLAPALLAAVAKVPYDIGKVRALAKAGNAAAKYSYYSWLLFAACAVAVVVAILVATL